MSTMLSASPSMIVRSSLEEMLESLRRRDELEKPKDLPPALPSRPTSKARKPSARYSLPRSFRVGDEEPESLPPPAPAPVPIPIQSPPKEELKRKNLGLKVSSFGSKKKREHNDDSPYGDEREKYDEHKKQGSDHGLGFARPSNALQSIPGQEWEDDISYFTKKKLHVWCPVEGGHWESGTIQSTSEEKACVSLSNGTVAKVSTGELFPANPDVLEGVDDLIQLSYLNEPSVLHNLQYRYSRDMIYSKAGPVLIAINPFKDVSIHGNDILMAYKQQLADSSHVHAIADTAYNEMMRDEVNQSIIISGASGSGKTETAKIAMQYLAALVGGCGGIEDEVLQTSCILEAFGNAKTSKNDNSSRFGKLIEIHFSTSGKICGANIQTFLLEKSRVVQLLQQQQVHQQNSQFQQLPLSQHQQHISSNNLPTSMVVPSQHFPAHQPQSQNKPLTTVRAHSGLTEGDAPSCSTSPSTANCQVPPSNLVNRNQQISSIMVGEPMVEPASNLMHELQSKPDIRIKHELPSTKGPEQLKYKGTIIDQLEASSSATSYCLDAGTIQQNYSLPTFCMDSDVQSNPRSNLPFASNVDGLAPDTLLSRGFDSQKDLQNLLSNYGGTPRDIETELSTAGISSQSFGLPSMPFKPGCSNDVAITETGVLNGGVWASQTQRMRTYTKVQKRGSVGRSIDVTRYTGYDELRRDLARMFGIEGQLEDPQRTDWKLVYVDHENDILLVGDDPWEEFVSCVQSIKILSSVEVQQMSLDGDLGHAPVPNQACSGTDSGNNAWRGQYDDNSAASFNR